MIDMEVRWSDGWKAGNVLQIYEKAVVIFAVGFFPFFTTDNLGNRRINGLYFAKSSTYVLDVVWYFIIPIIDLGIEQEFFAWGRKRGMRLLSVIKKIWYGFVVVIGIVVILIGLFISIFTYTPEHIVVQNGVRMVASVNSFLQEQVYYYEYKNLIFRGSEELGYENYGNGGRDPLEDENRDPRYKHFKE